MRTSLVISFIGEDRPGVIEQISTAVSEHEGNWLESRMSQLAGKFAGIVRIGVSTEHIKGMTEALEALESQGLSVLVAASEVNSNSDAQQILQLSMIGLDRPGIVREVSQALAKYGINVLEMTTDISHAPMTGELLFNADASIEVPENVDIKELHDKLEVITNDLAVDMELITGDEII